MPRDKSDHDFQSTFLKTTIDVCKTSARGAAGNNFIAKIFMENIDKSINFELKCPMKKLSFYFHISLNKFQLKFLFLQGVYEYHDLHLSNSFVPPNFYNVNVLTISKTFGRVRGVKSVVHMYTMSIYGKMVK